MAVANKASGGQLEPLVISREFLPPPELLFRAWSSAEHLKRWFCPAAYTVPDARVEFTVGDAFDICMRSPQDQDHWTRGRFTEIVPHSRLVIDMHAVAADNRPLFRAHTVVSLAGAPGGGTRLKITQRYSLIDPAAAPMIQGAPIGWGQTLERLALEVARMRKSQGLNS